MKRLLLLLAICGIWFSACQNNSSNPSPATDATSGIETLVASAARLAVSTDSVTVRTCKGKLTEIDSADLATTITDYISSTYPGATVKYAAKDVSGRVVVAIVLADGTITGLLFNADGTFGRELKQHAPKAKLTRIDSTALPVAVTDYIDANYTGAAIKEAATNVDGEYYVAIKTADAVKVLIFNADGTFNKEIDKPNKRRGRH
ncbi:hypothetical protein [Dyadobacter bucti]|uniref:hypothetical protein n=1 Tax=Dyadobacter bucti TaxID=2572203 RepID=UPI0011087D6D|nr:hypothetical protein [Dyadobacter bucti]